MNVSQTDRARISRFAPIALGIGIVGAVAMVLSLVLGDTQRFYQAYLVGYLFWLSISLGGLGLVLLHYLAGGDWGFLIRQPLEAAARTTWVMAILFIPILLGLPQLYIWARPDAVAADPVLVHKSAYLNVPFFIGRAVFYFAVWLFFAFWMYRKSRQTDIQTDPERRAPFNAWAAIGTILFTLTFTFAVFDWMMSINPHWMSAVYGLILVNAAAIGGLTISILCLPFLLRQTLLAEFVTPRRIRDIGAILLAAVTVWAYLSYSQLIIIWSGNLPHDNTWYIIRSTGSWLWMGIAIFVVQFLLPFLILISLRAKRNLRVLSVLSSLILVMHLLDTYWYTMPEYFPAGLSLHWLDFVAPLAIGGIWLFFFLRHLLAIPLPILPQPHHKPDKALRNEFRQALETEAHATAESHGHSPRKGEHGSA